MKKSASSKKNTTSASSGNGTKKSANTKRANAEATGVEDSMLADFFADELKDIYWAEKHLVKTLPKMKKAANSEELKQAIEEHIEVTNTHVSRLEQAFEMLGKKAQAKKCDAMEGITTEGQNVVEETEAGTSTRDVGIIMSAQKVEHYEIATYGGLIQLAKTLGYNDIAELLVPTLNEEKEADEKLTEIAENSINYEASLENEEEEG
ncbi:MAG TPA: ferritin-like domain-containing protein [Chitinophagaceae bacterium]|jgi:ferritin-like metal-binding protein YciE